MTNVPKWISQMSAVALAVTSVSAFAGADDAGGAPDFLMHQGSVNMKVSTQGAGKIEKQTIKTNDVINLIMDRPLSFKVNSDEKLGVVTACDANDVIGFDDKAAALVVYNKKTEVILSDPERAIILDLDEEVIELDKNGDDKKGELLAHVEEAGLIEDFLALTGTTKYGKIGNNVAKDGEVKDHWNKDAVCVKSFKTKSMVGADVFGNAVVMSGKINASSPKFARDFRDPIWPVPGVLSIAKRNDVEGNIVDFPDFGAGERAEIEYIISVRNVGEITLTDVEVQDKTLSGALVCTNNVGGAFGGILEEGEQANCVGDRFIEEDEYLAICAFDPDIGPIGPGTVVNIATANSNQSNPVATADTVLLDCFPDVPEGGDNIGISKNAIINAEPGGIVVIGDVIDYVVDVQNLSPNAQTDVVVSDVRPGADVDCFGFTNLAPFPDVGGDDSFVCETTLVVTPEIYAEACVDHEGDIGYVGWIRNVAVVTSAENGIQSFGADEFVAIDCGVTIQPI